MPSMLHQFCEATRIHSQGEQFAINILHNHFHKFRLFAYSLQSTLAAIAGVNVTIEDCTSSQYEIKFQIQVTCEDATLVESVRQHMFSALSSCDPALSSQFTYNIEPNSANGLNITIINVSQLEEEADYEG